MPELRSMKLLPVISLLLSILAAWFFLFGSNVDGEAASDPTLKASDTWCVWEMWDASRVPVDGASWWSPESGDKLHKFSNDSLFLFHVSRPVDSDSLDANFQSMSYKAGYLVGTEEALYEWSENPGEMSAKWKISNESYTKLSRKDGVIDFFELKSGDDRIVVWGEADEIDGFKSHAYLDRTVFTREQSGLASDLIERESYAPLDQYGNPALLGVTRDHREGTDMDIIWNQENSSVDAVRAGGEVVWSKTLKDAPIGRSFEVDLYENNKYQTAFATPSALYVVDRLGHDVKGFPYDAEVSGFAVFDYDRNKKFRILLATTDGDILNLRAEGRLTSGWNFKRLSAGRHVVHLAHIRVGSKDYIYGGCYDGSVILLKRSGRVRGSTPVVINPRSKPAFRLSNTIGKSTVIFVDSEGWLQELTLSEAEPVGISGLTRADQVTIQDIDGDGKTEVVTYLNGVRSVWNSRNELVL
jgi:hypothetical protein